MAMIGPGSWYRRTGPPTPGMGTPSLRGKILNSRQPVARVVLHVTGSQEKYSSSRDFESESTDSPKPISRVIVFTDLYQLKMRKCPMMGVVAL